MLVELELFQPRAAGDVLRSIPRLTAKIAFEERTMKRVSKLLSLACLPLAGIAIGVSPAMAQPVTTLDVSALVPALALPQGLQDLEIEKSLPAQAAVDAASVRLLGEDVNAKYSVAQAGDGKQICIIVQLRDTGSVGGSSCTTKEQFALAGVRVGLQENGGHAVVTYLLPADVDATPVKITSGLVGKYVNNLVVQSEGSNGSAPVELNRLHSDVKFNFTNLPLALK